jgi:hypothetical protein
MVQHSFVLFYYIFLQINHIAEADSSLPTAVVSKSERNKQQRQVKLACRRMVFSDIVVANNLIYAS